MRQVITRAFNTGKCRHPQIMTMRGGTWRVVDFPSIATLILHPEEGPILFDTGYDPSFLTATEPFPERFYRWTTPVEIRERHDAASQCRAAGVDPNEVRHVVVSHFHGDHVAGLHAFPRATVYCARSGLEDLRRCSRFASTRRGFLPNLLPPDLTARTSFFEDSARVALPSSCAPFEYGVDLLGDGSLLAIELPGHCPGHWGLLLNDAHWGLHFLVADAAWSSEAIRRNTPPPAITTAFLGNTHNVRTTLRKLHVLQSCNPEIRLSPSHCAERAAEIGTAS